MTDTSYSSHRIAWVAIGFEGGLVLLAFGVGWLVGRWPLPGVAVDGWKWAEDGVDLAWGAVAAVPMVVGLVWVDRFPVGCLQSLRRAVEKLVLPWIRGWTVLEIALVSVAAGIGEEMLFRGLLQSWLTAALPGPWGMAVALATAAMAFGACHWITTDYAVVAAVMGLYLGGLLLLSGSLLTPITTHAAYDFVALVYLTRRPRDRRDGDGVSSSDG